MQNIQKFHNLFINSLLLFILFSLTQNRILLQETFTLKRRELAQQSIFNYLLVLEDVEITEDVTDQQKSINNNFQGRILPKYDEKSYTTGQNKPKQQQQKTGNNYDEQSLLTNRQNQQKNKYDEISHVTQKSKIQRPFDEKSYTTSQNRNQNLQVQGRSINLMQNRQNVNQNNFNSFDEVSALTNQNNKSIQQKSNRNQFDEISAVTNQSRSQNTSKNYDAISTNTKSSLNKTQNSQKNQDISYVTAQGRQQLQIELQNVSKSFLTYYNYYKQNNVQNLQIPKIVKKLSNYSSQKNEEKIKNMIESLFADLNYKSTLNFKLQIHVYEKIYENNQFIKQQIDKEEPIDLHISLPFYKQQIKKIEFLVNQAQPWLNHYYEQSQKDKFEEKINQKLKVNTFFSRRNKLQFKANWMDFKNGVLQIMIQATVPFQDEDFMNYKRGQTVFDDGRYLLIDQFNYQYIKFL